jgi:hypothetical protein
MLFLDCEFDGHGGALISMALVSDKGGEFYGVLPLPENVHPWVAEHVIPALDAAPEPLETFRKRLRTFLSHHKGETVVADWPADFGYLMQAFVGPTYDVAWEMDLEMRLITSHGIVPARPHNALSDAIALMAWYLATRHSH